MANRIITRSGPILVKNIKSGIPTNLFTTLLSLKDVTGTPTSTNSLIQWDSDLQKFTFSSSTISNEVLSNLVDSAVSETVDSDYINSILGASVNAATLNNQPGSYYLDYNNLTNVPAAGTDSSTVSSIINEDVDKAFVDALNIDADTLDGQHGTYYLDYNNFVNTPSIPSAYGDADVTALVDSAYVQARVTIPAAGTDSATVRTIADEQIALADTHDSAAVQGQINTALAGFTSYDSAAVDAQIDSAITQSFIDTFDTHDSALVQGQIDATVNALDLHDSALVQGQIDATLAGDVTVGGNLTVDGYIAGPSSMTIDPATVGTDSGTLIILGNLQVEGETTTVNSTTVSISDKNIVLADSATNASQADDAGITVNGANATIQYKATGDKWEFNKPLFHGADRVLTTADDLHDSDLVQGQIDATVNALDTHDSAAVVGQINLVVDKAFVDALTIDYNTLSNKPSIPSFGTDYVDSAEVNALIAAADTHDSAATLAQINAVVNALDIHDSAATLAQINTVVNALDTHDSAAVAGQIAATSIGDLVDVFLNGGPSHNQVIKWDSDTARFILGNDLTSGGAGTDADTLDGQDGSFYRDYNNLTNTPTIPQHGVDYVDSAITATLIDSALNAFDAHDSAAVQGQIDASLSGFTSYDSAAVDAQIDSAVTESFVRAFIDQAFIDTFDTHDSAAIQAMIDATDTHDSAAVVDQINLEVDKAFVDALDVDAITLGGNDSAYYLNYNNFTNTPTIPTLGNDYVDSAEVNTLIAAADTHDSAAIQAMIDATLAVTDTHDSAAVLGQINLEVDKAFVDALDVDAITLGGNDSSYYLDYNNFANTPTIPTLGTDYVDSAQVNILIAAADTHDSAAVVGQINLEVDKTFVDALSVDADTVDGLHANQFLRSDADDTTTGNLTVEGNLTTSNLITFEGDSATVVSLTTAIVATAAMSSVQAIEATVVSVNAASGERQVSRVLLTHDTTDTYMNEYAVINTGASDEFTLDADTSGGDFRLKLDNISGNTLFAKSSITYL